MKIAMFTDSYLPSRDGVVTSVLLSKRELERMGHEVFIFAPDPGPGVEKAKDVNYLRSVRFRGYAGYSIPLFPTNKNEILERLDVDVIHAQGLLFQALRSMFAGRTLRKPVVVTFHTMITEAAQYYNFTPLPDGAVQRLMWIYLKRLMQRAEVVIAPTEAIKQELMRYAPRIRRVEVVPTGVDRGRFHPGIDGGELRRKSGLDDHRVILHVGRIAREKNLELVLNGFALLSRSIPDVRLCVVGEGPAKDHYIAMAKDLGIADRTLFIGFVDDALLPQYYAMADVLTLASRFETQGLVLLEAMACGTPVTGINYRAVAELIQEGHNGFKFEESPESWAEANAKALTAPRSMRQRAAESTSGFSSEECARRTVELYEFAIRAKNERMEKKRVK